MLVRVMLVFSIILSFPTIALCMEGKSPRSKPCPDLLGVPAKDLGTGHCTANNHVTISLPDPFDIELIYNSLDRENAHGLGTGWRWGFERELHYESYNSASIELILGEGQSVRFIKHPSGSYYEAEDLSITTSRIYVTGPGEFRERELDGAEIIYRSFQVDQTSPAVIVETSDVAEGLHMEIKREMKWGLPLLDRIIMPYGHEIHFVKNSTGPGYREIIYYVKSRVFQRMLVGSEVFADGMSRLTYVELQDGRTMRFSYNNGLLSELKDAEGRSTFYGYHNPQGWLARIQNYLNQTTSFLYDKDRVVSTNSFGSEVVEIFTEVAGVSRLSEYRNNGLVAKFFYMEDGRMEKSRDHFGQETYYHYVNNSRIIRRINAPNQTIDYYYDSSPYPFLPSRVVVTFANGIAESTYSYYANGLLKSESANGRTLTYVRDGHGRVIEEKDSVFGIISATTYNDKGQVISKKSQDGRVISYAYANGNLTTATDYLGRVTRYTYNNFDQIVSIRDPSQLVTRYEYDSMNRMVAVQHELNGRSVGERQEINLNNEGRITQTRNVKMVNGLMSSVQQSDYNHPDLVPRATKISVQNASGQWLDLLNKNVNGYAPIIHGPPDP